MYWVRSVTAGQDRKKPSKEQNGKPNKFMLIGLVRQLAKLPLSWIHAVGGALGWMVYLLSSTYAARLRANLLQSGLWRDEHAEPRILGRNNAQCGDTAAALSSVWIRP